MLNLKKEKKKQQRMVKQTTSAPPKLGPGNNNAQQFVYGSWNSNIFAMGRYCGSRTYGPLQFF
jgi:hypothetical protein